MPLQTGYKRPAQRVRAEIERSRSRFLCTLSRADTVEQARACIAGVHAELPDADHHVYAFRVGYGRTVQEGMSDDGEPSGTAGPPVLAVLRGADIGDIVCVVTRYFGGTLLGTGGLVKAYGDAVRAALTVLPLEAKIAMAVVRLHLPYALYGGTERLAQGLEAEILAQDFAEAVTLDLQLPSARLAELRTAVRDMSNGTVVPEVLHADHPDEGSATG